MVIRRPALIAALLSVALHAAPPAPTEWHVATTGDDHNRGSASLPWRTIQHAAELARAGDTITVHAGIYRERVNPPRGGTADDTRITYRAAPGEQVEITGSEPATGWERVQGDTWKLTRPNSLFGAFNPYADVLHGDWFQARHHTHHTGAVYLDGAWLTESDSLEETLRPTGANALWFARIDAENTTIWAQFPGTDPNARRVEINVRQTVFYPDQPGRNFITVRGFTLRDAATPWAPPTAEQIGLIGTHWSKGWIIEDNTISHSTCSGISLGKYGDAYDNTSADSAEGYVATIRRAQAYRIPWTREAVGHHLVRHNTISHCEQAGIVGSLGGAFSRILDNTIHDIHVRRRFDGAEMAGIKLHGAIDVEISHNEIFRTNRGIWLDWMAQGARVSGNLFHDNGPSEDLFLEVDHGPCLVDHNLFLSPTSLLLIAEEGAFAHNLITGRVTCLPDLTRSTPHHPAHSTALAGFALVEGGGDRFFNNLFVGRAEPLTDDSDWGRRIAKVTAFGLAGYDGNPHPPQTDGNVYLDGARPFAQETNALRVSGKFAWTLSRNAGHVALRLLFPAGWTRADTHRVTTARLGKARVPGTAFENPDGSPIELDRDYFDRPRGTKPTPGPFESTGATELSLQVR